MSCAEGDVITAVALGVERRLRETDSELAVVLLGPAGGPPAGRAEEWVRPWVRGEGKEGERGQERTG